MKTTTICLLTITLLGTTSLIYTKSTTSVRTHAQTIIQVEKAGQEIILEKLAEKGIGNMLDINHALSYFKALQKEILVKQYHEYLNKIKQKALEDLRLYFYLTNRQIKNMVFKQLYPFLELIDKHISRSGTPIKIKDQETSILGR